MDSIQTCLLGILGYAHFIFVSTCLCMHALFEISFGIPNHVTEKFCKLGGMFCFFPCISLESICNFRITFAICLTGHSKIHTNFGTFTVEMSVQVFNHFITGAFCNAYLMLGNELKEF